ncbi:hypothetical protein [Bradyrhizobium elkanii]|uniref:hypothetical protein n=1 Tax=Bradyrhizobium elkanii TaxID=29448 RepID=UPI001BAC8598|nr:hypothetical protein [Bradyrhizobium elkanii]MBR1163520.1 hypothetical protein [Bradyrhizobium elkanii]
MRCYFLRNEDTEYKKLQHFQLVMIWRHHCFRPIRIGPLSMKSEFAAIRWFALKAVQLLAFRLVSTAEGRRPLDQIPIWKALALRAMGSHNHLCIREFILRR